MGVEEDYKEFLNVVPEGKKESALIKLSFSKTKGLAYRQEVLERKILDPNVQMPRHEFLSSMDKDELNAVSNFIRDFHDSRGEKDAYQYAVLAVGSNLYGKEHNKNIWNFFKKAGYGLDDYVDEGVTELEGTPEEHQQERRLTLRQILNNEHNDIDLLFLPDPIFVSPRLSYQDSIRPYMDRFYENLDFLNYDPKSRPIHAYFRDYIAEIKIKSDLVNEVPFSVLARRGNVDDLQLALWNGLGRGVFENPVYEHLLDSNK